MPRAPRAQDASCAICMESLFNAKDDLDEVLPIATPDCGHVFHEKCLTGWFKAQTHQYIAQRRLHDPDRREGSPTASDAPVMCPTCRTECFADPETGEPGIHRLFINFGEDGMGDRSFEGGSSQLGSSPLRPSGGGGWGGSRAANERGKEREREVMGLARRAKNLTEELKGINERSREDDVMGTIRRVEGLRDDVISDKALAAVKTYIGGLTVALNSFRSSLAANPLVPTLQARIRDSEDKIATLTASAERLRRIQMPAEISRAVQHEKVRAEEKIKKIRDEMELIRREFEREQVEKRATRKEREERDKAANRKLADIQTQLAKEVAERTAVEDQLRERTKLLRMHQQKAESRKDLKKELEALQAENARLKLQSSSMLASSSKRAISPFANLHDYRDSPLLLADSSIEEIDSADLVSYRTKSRKQPEDDSFIVDPPSFSMGDDSGSSRVHPTARTFAFDLDEKLAPGKKRKDLSKSKYFNAAAGASPDDLGGILVPATSPGDHLVDTSPQKRSRTNPFSTTKQASEKRRTLQGAPKPSFTEVIDLSSPDRTGNTGSSSSRPLRPSRGENVLAEPAYSKSSSSDASGGSKATTGQKTIVDILKIADKSGRPMKGVVVGAAKVKRRVFI